MKSLSLLLILFIGCLPASAQRRLDIENTHKAQIKTLVKQHKKDKGATVTIEDFLNGKWYYFVTLVDGERRLYDEKLHNVLTIYKNDSIELVRLENNKEYLRKKSTKLDGSEYYRYYLKESCEQLSLGDNFSLFEAEKDKWVFLSHEYIKAYPQSSYEESRKPRYSWALYDENGKRIDSSFKSLEEYEDDILPNLIQKYGPRLHKAYDAPRERFFRIGKDSIPIWSANMPFFWEYTDYFYKREAQHGFDFYVRYRLWQGKRMTCYNYPESNWSVHKLLNPFGYDGIEPSETTIEHRMEADGEHTDLVMSEEHSVGEYLATASGDTLMKRDFCKKVVYSVPEHAFYHYSEPITTLELRGLVGAVFVRDTMLNVPPLFNDVRYVQQPTGEWMPMVKRKEFAPWEPYVRGKDYPVTYIDEGEEKLDYGNYSSAIGYYWGKVDTLSYQQLKVFAAAMLRYVEKEVNRVYLWAGNYKEDCRSGLKPADWEVLHLDIDKQRAMKALDRLLEKVEVEEERPYCEELVLAIDNAYAQHKEACEYYDRCKEAYEARKQEQEEQARQEELARQQRREQQRMERRERAANIMMALFGGIANVASQMATGTSSSNASYRSYNGGGGQPIATVSSGGSSSGGSDKAAERKRQEARLHQLEQQRVDFMRQLERVEQEIANDKHPSTSALSLKNNCRRHIQDIDNEINQIKNSY